MKYRFFKSLSALNKAVLPKLYNTKDFAKMSKAQQALAGYKRWVTFNFMDARDARENKN
jgi:hypothetical protein